MIDKIGILIEKITNLGAEVGGGNTIVILALLIVSICVLVIVRQNAKHNTQSRQDQKVSDEYIKEELELAKQERATCLGDKAKLTKELVDTKKINAELNELNKESQRVILEARAANTQMTEMFSKTMDYLMSNKND